MVIGLYEDMIPIIRLSITPGKPNLLNRLVVFSDTYNSGSTWYVDEHEARSLPGDSCKGR